MKRSHAMARIAAAFAFIAAALCAGCTAGKAPGPYLYQPPAATGTRHAAAAASETVRKAHGGTHNVNDAAFDAMFFRNYGVNPFIDADEDRLSTFAVDVDSGSYTLARAYLDRGHVPPKDAVRVEEFVNYFDYGYRPPEDQTEAFAIHLAAAPSKFGADKVLLRVGLKARQIDPAQRKTAVLTFVIDVSGSMAREDRLELVKKSLRLLVDQLQEGDAVGIAVYGSRGQKHMDHCGAGQREKILAAIDELRPSGATCAEEGIRLGYEMAAKAFRKGAINRVILCSDGVANVGRTGPEAILKQIKHHAEAGITLATVGFGMGNYNDVLMEQLADKGDGHYAYVDTLAEARRVFVENLTGTLQTVARDVKVQVEFDPKTVRSYRLLGYENRDVKDEDFRNDKADGGEIGAGHSATALYELKLWPERTGHLATVRVRYKDAEGQNVREVARDVAASDVSVSFEAAADSLKLAACVAEFAEILRKSYWARGGRLKDVLDLAQECGRAYDLRADLKQLAELIGKAQQLKADDAELAAGSIEE